LKQGGIGRSDSISGTLYDAPPGTRDEIIFPPPATQSAALIDELVHPPEVDDTAMRKELINQILDSSGLDGNSRIEMMQTLLFQLMEEPDNHAGDHQRLRTRSLQSADDETRLMELMEKINGFDIATSKVNIDELGPKLDLMSSTLPEGHLNEDRKKDETEILVAHENDLAEIQDGPQLHLHQKFATYSTIDRTLGEFICSSRAPAEETDSKKSSRKAGKGIHKVEKDIKKAEKKLKKGMKGIKKLFSS